MINDNRNKNCPCMKCEDRKESCHASCLVYLQWAKDKRIDNKKYKDSRNLQASFFHLETGRNRRKNY